MFKIFDNKCRYCSTPFKILLIMFGCFFLNYLAFYINTNSNPWQLLYLIPMLLGAYLFNEKGSLFVAIIIILLNSPLLLLTKFKLSFQLSSHWLIRSFIYLGVSFMLGNLIHKIKTLHSTLIQEKLKSNFSGFYNTTKLVADLNKLNEEESPYDLVFMHIINLDELRKYLDSIVFSQLISQEFKKLQKEFKECEIYSYSSDQYIFLVKGYNLDDKVICNLVNNKIHQFVKSNLFDKYSVKFQIKCGIVNSYIDNHPRRLIEKARITSDRGPLNETSIYIFDKEYYDTRQLYYEVSLSLSKAIENDELYIVYQPIIDIKSQKISSCEALLRWDRGSRKAVSPDIFIKVAEQTGLIIDVSKWLLRNTIINKKQWQLKGVSVIQSINISSKELIDSSFQDWVNNLFTKDSIEYYDFNIEVTERVLSNNDVRLKKSLLLLQEKGCSIEIDDFGTGYNSLKLISTVPIDIVKLDKFFIDNLNDRKTKVLVKYLIAAVHELGGIVIAEGVENKQQFDILVKLNCDKIQGFYFSKPLESEEFCLFYNNFNFSNYM